MEGVSQAISHDWPSLTAVIPCFNAGTYIARALDSVLAQDYPRLRVIVIDDGSTDDSASVLARFAERISVLRHPGGRNCGQAASLNLGIAATDSELIAFLDADDYWFPGKLRKQVQAMLDTPAAGLSYTNGMVIDENDRSLYPIIEDGFEPDPNPDGILMNCYIRTPSMVMVRRSVMHRAGAFTNALQSIDHEMWIRFGELTEFCFLDEKLTGYRQHSGQQSLRRRQWEDGFKILHDARQRYPYSAQTCRRRKAVLYYRLGEYDAKHGHKAKAAFEFLLAFVFDPRRAVRQVLGLR